jgi:hypothetical protein
MGRRAAGLIVGATIWAVACASPPVAPAPTSTSTSVSLSIDGNASLSLRGETSQLKALVTMADGRVEDRTATADWSSSNVAVATVSRSGLLTAMGDGRAVVTARLDALTATKPVLVDLP